MREKIIFCWRLEGYWRKEQDSFVRGTDPRIRSENKYHYCLAGKATTCQVWDEKEWRDEVTWAWDSPVLCAPPP
jgi:hypothetical protein